MARTVEDSEFQTKVLGSEQPVLVDFWAEWCGPCRALGPVIEEISKANEGKANVFKCDTDANPISADQYGVTSIPTMVFFKGGKKVESLVGYKSQADIQKVLDRLASN
jgi:thioredoxin 1